MIIHQMLFIIWDKEYTCRLFILLFFPVDQFLSPFLRSNLMQEPFFSSVQQSTFPGWHSLQIQDLSRMKTPDFPALEVAIFNDLNFGIFSISFSTTRFTGVSILPTQTISVCLNFFEKFLSLSFSKHSFSKANSSSSLK